MLSKRNVSQVNYRQSLVILSVSAQHDRDRQKTYKKESLTNKQQKKNMKELKYEAPKVEIIEVAVEKGYASTTGFFSFDNNENNINVVDEDERTWGDLWSGKVH